MTTISCNTTSPGGGLRFLGSIHVGLFAFFLILTAVKAEELQPDDLSAEEFLQYARRPFVDNAWGYFKGDVQYKSEDKYITESVELSILFKPDYIRCQIVIDEDKANIYDIHQVTYGAEVPELTIEFPESDPEGRFLDRLGIHSTDITFSFLFWKLREQQEETSVRGRRCRVMKLAHPDEDKEAIVAFSAKHFFPLKVEFMDESDELERTVEFTDFKKYKDFWYIKSLRITGDNWKTRLDFDEAELAHIEDKPVPSELFLQPAGE